MPDLATLSEPQRWGWLLEIMRVGGNANQRAGVDSPLFPSYIALAAGVASRRAGEADPLWQPWFTGEATARQRYIDFYEALATNFGLRLRSGLTWEHFGTITDALTEGLAIRAPINPDGLDRIQLDTPHQTDPTGWSLFAVGFVALVQGFFEPDPQAPITVSWNKHRSAQINDRSGLW